MTSVTSRPRVADFTAGLTTKTPPPPYTPFPVILPFHPLARLISSISKVHFSGPLPIPAPQVGFPSAFLGSDSRLGRHPFPSSPTPHCLSEAAPPPPNQPPLPERVRVPPAQTPGVAHSAKASPPAHSSLHLSPHCSPALSSSCSRRPKGSLLAAPAPPTPPVYLCTRHRTGPTPGISLSECVPLALSIISAPRLLRSSGFRSPFFYLSISAAFELKSSQSNFNSLKFERHELLLYLRLPPPLLFISDFLLLLVFFLPPFFIYYFFCTLIGSLGTREKRNPNSRVQKISPLPLPSSLFPLPRRKRPQS